MKAEAVDSLIEFLLSEPEASVAVPDRESKEYLMIRGVSPEQVRIMEGLDLPTIRGNDDD